MDGPIADEITFQLVSVERLDVSAMVLIKVGQAVVEVDWWSDVVRDVELEGADWGVGNPDTPWRSGCI